MFALLELVGAIDDQVVAMTVSALALALHRGICGFERAERRGNGELGHRAIATLGSAAILAFGSIVGRIEEHGGNHLAHGGQPARGIWYNAVGVGAVSTVGSAGRDSGFTGVELHPTLIWWRRAVTGVVDIQVPRPIGRMIQIAFAQVVSSAVIRLIVIALRECVLVVDGVLLGQFDADSRVLELIELVGIPALIPDVAPVPRRGAIDDVVLPITLEDTRRHERSLLVPVERSGRNGQNLTQILFWRIR